MIQYLAELYSPRPAWLALTPEQRQAYFARIAEGMPGLNELGVEVLAMGETEPALHGAPQRFFAIWRLPDAKVRDALLAAISETGWHDYFDTINATGPAVDFPTHLGQLAAA
jgi:hypothetical protein